MKNYRDDFKSVQRDYYWTLPRVVFALVALSVLAGSAGWAISIMSQPARIVSKTFDANNVINNYEWFYDARGNFEARIAQVKQFKSFLGDEMNDKNEKARTRIDMAAIQQSCRDLAQRYNVNAEKLNRGIFRSNNLPESLNAGECE
jgi:hypothetical protein